MPLQAEQRVVAVHPDAVVRYADERNPSAANHYLDRLSLRVDAVLDQFLDHRRGPFDHFPRRHLAGESVGK